MRLTTTALVLLLSLPLQVFGGNPIDRTWKRVQNFFRAQETPIPSDSILDGNETTDQSAPRPELTVEGALEAMIAAAEFQGEMEIYRARGQAYLASERTRLATVQEIMVMARLLCDEFPESWDRNRRVLKAAFDHVLERLGAEAELGLTIKEVRGLWLKDYALHRFDEAKVEATLLRNVAAAIEKDPGPGIALRSSDAVGDIPQALIGYRNMYHSLNLLLELSAKVETQKLRQVTMEDFARKTAYCNYNKGGEDTDFLVCAVSYLQDFPEAPTWRDHLALAQRLARLRLPARKVQRLLHFAFETVAAYNPPDELTTLFATANKKIYSTSRFEAEKARDYGLKLLEEVLEGK